MWSPMFMTLTMTSQALGFLSYQSIPHDVPGYLYTPKSGAIQGSAVQNTNPEVRSFSRRVKTPLEEKVDEKTAYIAAVIDRQHSDWQEYLNNEFKTQRKILNAMEVEIMFRSRMLDILKKVAGEILELSALTRNKEASAKEVSKHFAVDHIEPMMKLVVDTYNVPKFFHPLSKAIAEESARHVRALFSVSLDIWKF